VELRNKMKISEDHMAGPSTHTTPPLL
jgi:hypothetical protein